MCDKQVLSIMSALLLGAVLLGNMGVCLTEQVSPAPPAQVRFISVDYKTTLVWSPPTNSSSLKYYVQWKIYGEPQWLDVDQCQGIEKPQCDLSDLTSALTEWYYARVYASSASVRKSSWALSPRFSPRWDSQISPPVLRPHITEKGIVVRVKPPRSQVRKRHRDLFYKIYLTRESGQEEVLEMDCCFHKLTVKEVKPNTEYCFQAQVIIPLQARSSARSEIKCVTMP